MANGRRGPATPDVPTGRGPNSVQGHKISEKEKELYCQELAKHGIQKWASNAIGRSNSALLHKIKRDPEFAAQVEEAKSEADARIEAAAIQRGVDGVERLEVSAGRVVKDDDGHPVTRREYSDALLLAVLRARDTRFHTKQKLDVSHEHKGGGANISTDDIFRLDPEDRDQFLHLLSKIEAARRGENNGQAQLTYVEDAEFSQVEGEDEDEDAELAAIL